MKCGICGKEIVGGIIVECECLEELKRKAGQATELKRIQEKIDTGLFVGLPCNIGYNILTEDNLTYEITGVSWGGCEPLKFIAVGIDEANEGNMIEFEAAEVGDNITVVEKEITRCRICGCTNYRACLGGCYWVEPDLCSQCEKEIKAAAEK